MSRSPYQYDILPSNLTPSDVTSVSVSEKAITYATVPLSKGLSVRKYKQKQKKADNQRNKSIIKATGKDTQFSPNVVNPQWEGQKKGKTIKCCQKNEITQLIPNCVPDQKNGNPPQSLGIQDFITLTSLNQQKNLRTYICKPDGQPKAVVYLFHGLNSWTGHGYHMIYYLKLKGFLTVAFDYTTFGRSDPVPKNDTNKEKQDGRGIVFSQQEFFQDCLSFMFQSWPQLLNVKGITASTKKFAMGLSLGGVASYNLCHSDLLSEIISNSTHSFVKKNKDFFKNFFDGSILMAPAIKLQIGQKLLYPNDGKEKKFRMIDFVLRMIKNGDPSKNLLGKAAQKQNKKWYSRFCPKIDIVPKACISESVTNQMSKDKFVPFNTLRYGTINFLVSQSDSNAKYDPTIKKYQNYTKPFFMIQGGCDGYVNPMNSFSLFQLSKSKNKKMYFDENMYHDVWHDPNIFNILCQANCWIDEILQKSPKTTKSAPRKAPAPKVKAKQTIIKRLKKAIKTAKAAPKKKKISKSL